MAPYDCKAPAQSTTATGQGWGKGLWDDCSGRSRRRSQVVPCTFAVAGSALVGVLVLVASAQFALRVDEEARAEVVELQFAVELSAGHELAARGHCRRAGVCRRARGARGGGRR